MTQPEKAISRPRVALTMGDPAGIGPEICLRVATGRSTTDQCVPIIFGDQRVLRRVAQECGLPLPATVLEESAWLERLPEISQATILDIASIDASSVRAGSVSAETGQACYTYVERAIQAALAGEVAAIVTGPVHKEAWKWAGVPYPGHTELLAARTAASRVAMMLTCEELTCSFVTAHIGYRDVPLQLSTDRILDVIELSHDAVGRLRGRQPKLVACGLNPHAGEHGLFGDREEERFILPAIRAARDRGIQIEGPLAPDTAFLAERRQTTDCFICMYHDQGHIPLKALAFDVAVNVTLGLPVIRTSVDHGTALEIAWQGKAKVTSLVQAVKLAVRLTREKEAPAEVAT